MRDVWTAAAAVADVLRATAVIERFAQVVSRTSDDSTARGLQHILAGYGKLKQQPLLLGYGLEFLRDQPLADFAKLDEADPQGDFRRDAMAVANAATEIIEFIRSRLPWYSLRLRLPHTSQQLVDDQSLLFGQLPWHFIRGLHEASQPRDVAGFLEADTAQAREIRRATVELSRELEATPQWIEFGKRGRQLTGEARAELSALRGEFRRETAPENLDMVAGKGYLRRVQAVEASLRSAEDNASTEVAEYFVSFRRLNELINDVFALLSGLVAHDPIVLTGCDHLLTHGGKFRASISHVGFQIWEPRAVVRFDSEIPSVDGLGLLRGVNFRFRSDLGSVMSVTGKLLPDSEGL